MGGDSSTPFDMSSGLMQGAAGGLQRLGNWDAVGDAQNYMNPYTEDVIGRTTQNINDNAALQMRDIGDAAQAADAFGGGRHGLVEGQMMGDTNQAIGDMSAQYRNQGFQQGIDNSYRNAGVLGNAVQGAQGLGEGYYNIGNNLMDRQQVQGDRAYDVNQGVMDQAQGIGQGNDISNIWSQIQGGLGSNPLMGAGSSKGTSQVNPGFMTQLGTAAGIGGSLLGGGMK